MDPEGRGIGASYQRLATFEPHGEWVWLLDDDDECIYPELVADLRVIRASSPGAEVIMVRMDHGEPLGILPDRLVWEKTPVLGHLGVSAFIVRKGVWMQHRHVFASSRYGSDFDFISHVFLDVHDVVWFDVVASRCQNGRSLGAIEFEYAVRPPVEMMVLR